MIRCIGWHPEPDDPPDGWAPPLARDGLLCTGHAHRLGFLIGELAGAHGWLRCNLQPGGTGESDKISGSRVPPAPLRLDALDHADLIADILASWSRMIAEDRELVGPDRGPVECARFLAAHHGWIIFQPWVDDMLGELGDLLRRARTIAPWAPGLHRLPAPCPECDSLTLVRWDGDDEVICARASGGCGVWWREEDYRRLVMILADEIREAS